MYSITPFQLAQCWRIALGFGQYGKKPAYSPRVWLIWRKASVQPQGLANMAKSQRTAPGFGEYGGKLALGPKSTFSETKFPTPLPVFLTKLKLSMVYHPQIDGQTEIINQYLDQRLQPFINYFQDNQAELLPLIDYAQAILPYDSIGFAPIQLKMGYLPRISFDWERLEGPQTIREKLSYKEAQQYAKRLEEAQIVAYINLKKA